MKNSVTSHTHKESPKSVVPSLSLLSSPLSYELRQKGKLQRILKVPPSPSYSLSNQREEGGSRTEHRDFQPMRAHRGTRCPFCMAHHRVSDEVLVVSGARSREQALRRPKCSGCLITRQGQPEAPSEHEPLALPLATKTKDKATTVHPQNTL